MTTDYSTEQQALSDAWDEHLRLEFAVHDAEATVATMNARPRVNHVPVMTGGDGRDALRLFYGKYFLPQQPPDIAITPVSRTVGQGRVVDELNVRFTHTLTMDWMLPGVAPTGKPVELALVVVAQFEGTKLAHEHLYWDQASVLVQLGLIDPRALPVLGVESPRSVLDRTAPLNTLMKTWR
jgi:carboxymethylenebutenolidase